MEAEELASSFYRARGSTICYSDGVDCVEIYCGDCKS